MATTFLEIYTQAMTKFKSPRLSRLQLTNLQTFCIIMNGYLNFAITVYNPNIYEYDRLSDREEPSAIISQTFTGDDETVDFELTYTPLPDDNVIFNVFINDIAVDENSYAYDSDTNIITFESAPPLDSEILITWYNSGQFNHTLTNEEITMLSLALAWGWALQTVNDELQINGLLNDTDFGLHSEAQRTRAKSDWVKGYEEAYKRELSKADWRQTYRKYW